MGPPDYSDYSSHSHYCDKKKSRNESRGVKKTNLNSHVTVSQYNHQAFIGYLINTIKRFCFHLFEIQVLLLPMSEFYQKFNSPFSFPLIPLIMFYWEFDIGNSIPLSFLLFHLLAFYLGIQYP